MERRRIGALAFLFAVLLGTGCSNAPVAPSWKHTDFQEIGFDPFPGMVEDDHTLSVAFLKQHPGTQVAERLHGMRTAYDELRVEGCELYWLARGRMSDSKVWRTPMEKVLGGPATSRNVTTVRRLAAKLAAS